MIEEDSPCVVGAACRLPGSIVRPEQLWNLLLAGNWQECSTSPPRTRHFTDFQSGNVSVDGQGGWLGEEGIEQFDPCFFGIPLSEAHTLRPNVRLGLELTYEALQSAGIPPSSLRGKRVSVSVGVGTEDGWDMARWLLDNDAAFDANWAASSDPSGVSGRISHAFDFRGPCSTVSNACASGAVALHEGVISLSQGDSDVAIVGALATHFTPAPFAWAHSTGVASTTYRSSAFSSQADGYSPSEGAVFLVLKKYRAAKSVGDPIRGIVRAVSNAHNGATRTLITPSVSAQIDVTQRVLEIAKLQPEEIHLLEAHGTGTRVGDALEAEGIRSVFGTRSRDAGNPLFLSSSKTVVGHCHGAAALVGVLKILECFSNRQIPPHHVPPLAEFLSGPIVIPTETKFLPPCKLLAQINAFGFTGTVSSIVLESPSPASIVDTDTASTAPQCKHLFPFSAKSKLALASQVLATAQWILDNRPRLSDIAAILGICRDHHPQFRCALIVSSYKDFKLLLNSSLEDFQDLTLARFFNAPTDPRITADFLNLVPDDGPLSAERPSDGDSLHKLLDEGFLVEAAKQLYDQGHPLAFELAYEKTEIDPVLVVSFPFYQFERKRWWKDISISTPPGNALTHISSAPSSAKPVGTHPADGSGVFGPDLGQAAFEELVRQFGAPIQTPLSKKDPSVLPGPPLAYLITGANGMLGCQLLSRFLCHTNSHVYCIIRGDPLVRLQSAFKRFQQDERHLEDALTDGRLHLMQTGDLCAGQLGLTPVEYTTLLDHVDRIIHLAWPVNFNLPLKDFLPFLACTRGLVDFCYSAKKLVRFFFIGSYASTFNYLAERVPENELPLNVSYSLSQGYAVAKLIAEHSLIKTHRNDPSAFRLSIIRVGQVCGDTVTGFWSQDELMPMVIASLPALRALPALFPPVAWIPSDVCANTLFDLATTDQAPDRHLVHVANPVALPWPETAAEIFRFTLGAPAKLVEFGEYVQLIKAYTEPLPVRRLLPYFECLIETMPDRYAVLDVAVSMQYSKSLAACPPISGTLLQRIVQRVLDEQSPQQVAEPPTTNHRSPIFIFGPSLSVDGLVPDADILHRILNHAEESRKGLSDVSKLDGSLLFKQLTTLAMQLGTVESLAKDGIRPHAVLGYCFGEYAAAVTAGILPEVVAVDLLVRRALSLRSQERAGAMLNVFCDLRTIRPILACLPSPPSIAIVAGPSHVVLSGSVSQVQSAQAELQHRRVRTFLVDTPVPFHSALIDNAISQFQPPVYDAKTTSVAYISGVTASTISGHLLGVNYWLRHMRETVNFYGSMVFVRRTLPGHPVVDVGPHNTLSKIISRYEWSEVRVYSADTARSIPVTSTQCAAVSMTDSDTLSATTRGQTPGTSKEQIQVAEANTIALQVLKELFGYEPTVDLLRQSLHAIGLQSLDFIRFSDCYGAKTGLFLSLSAYIADTPLENVVSSAMKSAYSQPKHQISNT